MCTALCSRLVPYFSISHPTRGRRPGPYAKIPANAPLRRLVLDCIATMIPQKRHTLDEEDSLETVVYGAVENTSEEAYWAGAVTGAR